MRSAGLKNEPSMGGSGAACASGHAGSALASGCACSAATQCFASIASACLCIARTLCFHDVSVHVGREASRSNGLKGGQCASLQHTACPERVHAGTLVAMLEQFGRACSATACTEPRTGIVWPSVGCCVNALVKRGPAAKARQRPRRAELRRRGSVNASHARVQHVQGSAELIFVLKCGRLLPSCFNQRLEQRAALRPASCYFSEPFAKHVEPQGWVCVCAPLSVAGSCAITRQRPQPHSLSHASKSHSHLQVAWRSSPHIAAARRSARQRASSCHRHRLCRPNRRCHPTRYAQTLR